MSVTWHLLACGACGWRQWRCKLLGCDLLPAACELCEAGLLHALGPQKQGCIVPPMPPEQEAERSR